MKEKKYIVFFLSFLSLAILPSILFAKPIDLFTEKYCAKIYLYDSVEVSLYTPSMFRFRISHFKGEKFPPKYDIPFAMGKVEPWEKVPFKHWENGGNYFIETSQIKIEISAKNLSFRVLDTKNSQQIHPSDEPVYGMFKNGYSLFDNASFFNEPNANSRYSHWFYNPESGNYTDIFLEENLIEDHYFIYGPGYTEIYQQFNELVGPEPLLPIKAYGFFQTQHLSCNGTQQKLLDLAHTLRQREIPCDNLIIDFEWGDGCDEEKQQINFQFETNTSAENIFKIIF